MKVVVHEPLAVSKERLEEIFKPLIDRGVELKIYSEKAQDLEEEKERVKDADILLIANSPLRREVIEAGEKLKFIQVAFTGVDHVDLDAAREKGILVANAAGYSTPAVAELAIGLMIAVYRDMVKLDQATRESSNKETSRQRELKGKTMGIVGTGAIGSEVAKLGLAFGSKLIAYSRTESQELKDLGVEYLSLEELFKEADIISLHLPLNDSTRGLVNKDLIALMKEDAIIINTARGPIIESQALANALNQGLIGGAGLDVFDMEPPIDKDYPLMTSKNTTVLPHIGFASEEAMIRRAHIVGENILAYLDGKVKNIIE